MQLNGTALAYHTQGPRLIPRNAENKAQQKNQLQRREKDNDAPDRVTFEVSEQIEESFLERRYAGVKEVEMKAPVSFYSGRMWTSRRKQQVVEAGFFFQDRSYL